jgi:hypothetical protein
MNSVFLIYFIAFSNVLHLFAIFGTTLDSLALPHLNSGIFWISYFAVVLFVDLAVLALYYWNTATTKKRHHLSYDLYIYVWSNVTHMLIFYVAIVIAQQRVINRIVFKEYLILYPILSAPTIIIWVHMTWAWISRRKFRENGDAR